MIESTKLADIYGFDFNGWNWVYNVRKMREVVF